MPEEVFEYDNLIVGGPVITDGGVLITGQNLARGAVLGKITASDKLTLSLSASVDGSEVPYAVLNADSDATSADKNVPLIMVAQVNEDALILGADHTKDTVRDALRIAGIHLKTIVGA